jgi:adenosylcobinamide-GDP ribazoletransferase
MKRFWMALGFLTIFPAPGRVEINVHELGKASAWFPFIGALLGGIVALAHQGFMMIFPTLLSAVLTVTIWVFLTGTLHLDGLADSFDGLLNASSPERRLEIMQDPHIGAFGVVGLSLMISLKFAAISAVPVSKLWYALPLAASFARWLLLLAARQPMARESGMGAAFKQSLQPMDAWTAAIVPVGLGILAGIRGIIAILFAILATIGIARLARARLGGLTGDVFGLIVEVAEVTVLLVFAFQSGFIP